MGNPKEGKISSATARMRDHGIIRAEESKSFPGIADYSVHKEPAPEKKPTAGTLIPITSSPQPIPIFDLVEPQFPRSR